MDIRELERVGECVWETKSDYSSGMLVPCRIYATEDLVTQMDDKVFEQLSNVASLPGIERYALCMPDGHWGYGFPIGGVAAFRTDDGIITPGGIGYDINCGIRLIRTNLEIKEVQPKLKQLIDVLFDKIPSGVGSKGLVTLPISEYEDVLIHGGLWAVENGYGWKRDVEFCESGSKMSSADPSKASKKAKQRGRTQIGTLGSSNHFLEIGYVQEIIDNDSAKIMGLHENQLVVMFHCGSRGFGHQVASDFFNIMFSAVRKYDISMKDRELACAPFYSIEGQDYFGAMNAAANNAFANRQVITHFIRQCFSNVFGKDPEDLEMDVVYDVCHNIAKMEKHRLNGELMDLCVHRKGATRAYGKGYSELPMEYRDIGQPVLIAGSMGTSSYVLVGTKKAEEETFSSSCHGAGRTMGRRMAKRLLDAGKAKQTLKQAGKVVRTRTWEIFAEEIPGAYKNVDTVVKSAEIAGISRIVAKIKPMCTMK